MSKSHLDRSVSPKLALICPSGEICYICKPRKCAFSVKVKLICIQEDAFRPAILPSRSAKLLLAEAKGIIGKLAI